MPSEFRTGKKNTRINSRAFDLPYVVKRRNQSGLVSMRVAKPLCVYGYRVYVFECTYSLALHAM